MPVKKKTTKSTSSSEETPVKVSKLVTNKKDKIKSTVKKVVVKKSKDSSSSSVEEKAKKLPIKKEAPKVVKSSSLPAEEKSKKLPIKKEASKPKVVKKSSSSVEEKAKKLPIKKEAPKVVKSSSSSVEEKAKKLPIKKATPKVVKKSSSPKEEKPKKPPIKKATPKVVKKSSSPKEEKSKKSPNKKAAPKPKVVKSSSSEEETKKETHEPKVVKKKTPIIKEEISVSEEIIRPKKKTPIVKDKSPSKKTDKEEIVHTGKKTPTEIERSIAVESSSSSEDEPIRKIPIIYSPEPKTTKTIKTPRKLITPIGRKPAKTDKDITSSESPIKKSFNEIEGNIEEGNPVSLDRNGRSIPGFVEYVNAFHLDEVEDIPKRLKKYLRIDSMGKLHRLYPDASNSEEEKEIEINWNNPDHVEFYKKLLEREERGEIIPDKYVTRLTEYKETFPKKKGGKNIISPGMKIRTYSSSSNSSD